MKKTGGYKNLVVYWIATTIYDLTALFCKTYKTKLTYKTSEQMTGAARSGKQNIVEGSLEKSYEGYLKLLGVSRASYGELLEDFTDYLRQNDLKVWGKENPKVLRIRKTRDKPHMTYKANKTYMVFVKDEESLANLLITLCYKQMFLLDRLISSVEKKFVKEGGFRENLFRKRKEYLRK